MICILNIADKKIRGKEKYSAIISYIDDNANYYNANRHYSDKD